MSKNEDDVRPDFTTIRPENRDPAAQYGYGHPAHRPDPEARYGFEPKSRTLPPAHLRQRQS